MSASADGEGEAAPAPPAEPLPGTRDARSGEWLEALGRSQPDGPDGRAEEYLRQTGPARWWRLGPAAAALRAAAVSGFGKFRRAK